MFQSIELNKDSFENDKRHIQHIHVEDFWILNGSCVCMAISGVLCANRGFVVSSAFWVIYCVIVHWNIGVGISPPVFGGTFPPDNSPKLVSCLTDNNPYLYLTLILTLTRNVLQLLLVIIKQEISRTVAFIHGRPWTTQECIPGQPHNALPNWPQDCSLAGRSS